MTSEKETRPISILLLEDNPADAQLVQHQLTKSNLDLQIRVVTNEMDFQQALKSPCDIVLADYNLPQYNASEALKYLQEQKIDIPFIIVSGSIGEELAVKIMRQGAADYLLKDRLGRLGAAVTKAWEGRLQKIKRQQLEEAYRDSEKRYHSMFHNNHTVMLFLDPENGDIIEANPAAEKFYGWTRQQLTAMNFAEIDQSSEDKGRRQLKESGSGRKSSYQANHIGADGQLRSVEISSCPISVGSQRLLFVIISDVSAHKSMESLINNVFQSMGEALMVINRECQVIAANRAYCELCEQSLDEIIGKPCNCSPDSTLRPCLESNFICPAAKAFSSGKPQSVVNTRYDTEGRVATFNIRAFPMRDDAGEITSNIMVFNDTTEQSRLEAQLRQAQKMEAIGTLTGGIAHDFNNILTAIIGNTTLMRMKMEDQDPLTRFVDSITDATERATTLTKGLLAFSRKQVLNPVAVNLNKTILQMERLLRRVLREEIELCTVLPEQDINAIVDQGQLEQVLMNLVVNSRDAIGDVGEISISTGHAEVDDNFILKHGFGKRGKYALITVQDTGSGMDPGTMERIYEPFFTTKDVGTGTGLGLSTAYGIVKQHNGFIICDSELGKGTEFQLYLPLTERAENIEQPDIVVYEGGTESILLVEDDQNVRMMLKEVLQEAGYDVEVAASGNEAIEKFKSSLDNVHLLLLDVIMPGMNGREAYTELEKIKPGIKAIFVSGYTDDIIHKKGIMEEQIHFLSKPLSPAVLLKKVREVLDE